MKFSGYRFRFYPTPAQETVLRQTVGCCRFVYNQVLALRRDAWVNEKKSVSYAESSRRIAEMKKEEKTAWLKDVSSVALQQSIRHLDTAFSRFFKKKSDYPSFKSRRFGGSASFTSNGFTLRDGVFKVARISDAIDVRWSRDLPSQPKSCTISVNAAGQWHVSFLCEVEKPKAEPSNKKVGVDLGIESFATLSDGRKFHQNTKRFRNKVAKLQRRLSRKKKGSKNREKARRKLARAHQHIADARKDFLHKLSTKLVRENQAVAIEDLAVANMNKNHNLARSIGEQGWRSFRTMLEYKCEWYGRDLLIVDRFYPSSKTCNSCGSKHGGLKLSDRTWDCSTCGASHDRDVNAAKNILAAGQAVLACGEDVRPEEKRFSDGDPLRSRKNLGVSLGIPVL